MERYTQNPLSDEDILEVLDLHEGEGMKFSDIAKKFGRTKGVIAGAISRVKRELAQTDEDGNKNGTMPRGWWRRDRS